MQETLTVLGASVRAAVASARRAGWATFAADLFADVDLQQISTVERIQNYPHGLISAARHAPAGPWLYTGALENHPRVVAAISKFKPLLGNNQDTLRRVRDPFQVTEVMRAAGLSAPDVLPTSHAPQEGIWVQKPIRSAAGAGIVIHHPRSADIDLCADSIGQNSLPVLHDSYLQRFIPGTSVAAVFLAADRRARLLGATRQLVGEGWTASRPFQYAGSIGPICLSELQMRNLLRMGESLAREFHLVGLVGVDGVIQDGIFWPVEVNPRYTASVEVLERASGVALLDLHIQACLQQDVPTTPLEFGNSPRHDRCCGKAIVFATTSCVAGEQFCRHVRRLNEYGGGFPQIADIPPESTAFSPGQPVATVFAEGKNEADVARLLRCRVQDLRCMLDDAR